jgi:hypothetical protein
MMEGDVMLTALFQVMPTFVGQENVTVTVLLGR